MVELAILGFLAEGPLHGYQLRRRVAHLSGYARPVSDGTLSRDRVTTTAVLVVDVQDDDLHPDGAFATTGPADHAASQDVVRDVRAVLGAALTAGVAVFHERTVAYPGRDVGGSNAPICRMSGPESLEVGTRGPSGRRRPVRWEPTGQAGARVASMCARRPDSRS